MGHLGPKEVYVRLGEKIDNLGQGRPGPTRITVRGAAYAP